MSHHGLRFKKIFAELDRSSWLNEKTRMYALGDGLYFDGHPLHLFRHTMAQYYLAATNWSLAYVASLDGWENTEVLNKCCGNIPEHIKAQIAKSIHVRFDTLNLSGTTMTAPSYSMFSPNIELYEYYQLSKSFRETFSSAMIVSSSGRGSGLSLVSHVSR